jgi:hypothetical protein
MEIPAQHSSSHDASLFDYLSHTQEESQARWMIASARIWAIIDHLFFSVAFFRC